MKYDNKTPNPDWSLLSMVRDERNLIRYPDAGARAFFCREDGLSIKLIAAMLNRWWPLMAIEPYGVWNSRAVAMLTNSFRNCVNGILDGTRDYAVPAETHEDKVKFGRHIVQSIFQLHAQYAPDDLRVIHRRLAQEIKDSAESEWIRNEVSWYTTIDFDVPVPPRLPGGKTPDQRPKSALSD